MPETQEDLTLQVRPEGRKKPGSQLQGIRSQEGLVRPSTDWTRPTHVGEGCLFYSV